MKDAVLGVAIMAVIVGAVVALPHGSSLFGRDEEEQVELVEQNWFGRVCAAWMGVLRRMGGAQ